MQKKNTKQRWLPKGRKCEKRLKERLKRNDFVKKKRGELIWLEEQKASYRDKFAC